jgi:hypothetical protein
MQKSGPSRSPASGIFGQSDVPPQPSIGKRFDGSATDRCGDKGGTQNQPPTAKLQRKYPVSRTAAVHMHGLRFAVHRREGNECGDEKQTRG